MASGGEPGEQGKQGAFPIVSVSSSCFCTRRVFCGDAGSVVRGEKRRRRRQARWSIARNVQYGESRESRDGSVMSGVGRSVDPLRTCRAEDRNDSEGRKGKITADSRSASLKEVRSGPHRPPRLTARIKCPHVSIVSLGSHEARECESRGVRQGRENRVAGQRRKTGGTAVYGFSSIIVWTGFAGNMAMYCIYGIACRACHGRGEGCWS